MFNFMLIKMYYLPEKPVLRASYLPLNDKLTVRARKARLLAFCSDYTGTLFRFYSIEIRIKSQCNEKNCFFR